MEEWTGEPTKRVRTSANTVSQGPGDHVRVLVERPHLDIIMQDVGKVLRSLITLAGENDLKVYSHVLQNQCLASDGEEAWQVRATTTKSRETRGRTGGRRGKDRKQ